MSRLPMDFRRVLRRFKSPLPVYVDDAEGGYLNGIWQFGEWVRRPDPLNCIVLETYSKGVEYLGRGTATDAGISVITQDTLYFTDAESQTEENRQSFVTYKGAVYRVQDDANLSGHETLTGNTNVNIYHCVRYLE